MSLMSLLRNHAQRQPDAPALLATSGLVLTYAEVVQEATTLAQALAAAGATTVTPVATALPQGVAAALSFLGVALHSPCLPLDAALPAAELRRVMVEASVPFIVLARGQSTPARRTAHELGLTVIDHDVDFEARQPSSSIDGPPAPHLRSVDDVALLLHTSGTTARPKRVPLTQAQLLASAQHIAQGLALTSADRCLNVMPMFHIHGLVGVLLASMTAGASVVCSEGFDDAAFIDWVARFQPTWYSAVPTIHQAVAALAGRYRERLPAHRFRFIRSSSAALPPATLRRLEAGTGAPVIEAYGMTEASHQMASNPLPPGLRKPGSVGPPAGAQIAILDAQGRLHRGPNAGEIVVRGPGLMSGYADNDKAHARAFIDGWFRTGDLGHLDADGYLFIDGRLKEMVNRGGHKVSPREVDEALLEHEHVAQAAAFGVPHASLGEDLVAAVVPVRGAAVDSAALRQFLFARLAAYKVPSRIVLVDHLPTGATGKVQRHGLPQQLQAWLQSDFAAPQTDVEVALAQMLADVLTLERIGLRDNFFALGADSLTGMRAVVAINRAFAIELGPATLFHHPTLAELAPVVERLREAPALSDEDIERQLAAEDAAAVAAAQPPRNTPPLT